MSHTPTKKSVFDRIGGNSSSPAATTNKSTHGFCNAFVKTGTCPLGDTCKFIHEQPNLDKPSVLGEDFRITKTITRVVDMSSSPIKSTVTVSNEQRPVVVSNTIQSNRTVIESVTTPTDQFDRRLSGSERKQSQSRHSNSKHKSPSNSSESSKKKSHSSSYENCHTSKKKQRTAESDSSISSASDSEHTRSSRKHKKKSNQSTSSKHRKHESISSPIHDEEEMPNDQLVRQTRAHSRSPKRTIVIAKKKKDDDAKAASKESKSKSVPEIEFLGSKKVKPEKKPVETIHQQAENNKKASEVKREKKSPSKSISEQRRRNSSSTNTSSTSTIERNIQVKVEDTKHSLNKAQNSSERYERSDRNAADSTPPVVQLSPTPSIRASSEIPEKASSELSTEPEKTSVLPPPPSPVCVILDDDSSPPPSVDRKLARQTSNTPVKKTNEPEKRDVKSSKRSRDTEKNSEKDKSTVSADLKRKRLNDGSSKKVVSSSKSRNESHPSSHRADVRHAAVSSSRDGSSSRKHKETSDTKSSRSNDSKNHNSTKSRSNTSRRDAQRSSPEKKRSTHRHGKERENVTDSEEHLDEPILPKQTAMEAYMAMDWSSLSRDKRIPSNSQVTSRITRVDNSHNIVGASERLLTTEQKEKLQGVEFQALPLTHFMKQLQSKPTKHILDSCHRRFGSCAKDMIEMKHKVFTRSIEPVQRYEFINKEHFVAFQQAISSLLDQTSSDPSTVQTETTTADASLS